jgi:hypothetical protein
MVIWAAIPVLVLSVLASGPFRDSMPAFVETLASLGKHPRSHADFERRASSGLSYDGGCSGGLLWHRVFALAQSLPFPWQHFMEA